MSKAEAGNSSVFFIRHLTLLNTAKNVKFRKSFSLVPGFPAFNAGKRADQITSCASSRSLIPEVVLHLQE